MKKKKSSIQELLDQKQKGGRGKNFGKHTKMQNHKIKPTKNFKPRQAM